MRNNFSK